MTPLRVATPLIFALGCAPVAVSVQPATPVVVAVATHPVGTAPHGVSNVTDLDGIWTEHWNGLGYNERYSLRSVDRERVAIQCLTRDTYLFDDGYLVGAEIRVHKVNNPSSEDPYLIDYSLRRTGPDELCGTVSTDHDFTGPVCWCRGEPEEASPVEGEID
jgi:hypothetical protein